MIKNYKPDEYERRKFECGLYSGIVGVLDTIQQLGIGQSILSAYSQQTLDQMVDHFGLRKYFDHIAGLDNVYAAHPQRKRAIATAPFPNRPGRSK